MTDDRAAQNGSPALMRAINAARVVREIRTGGPVSRASLARTTGLSKPTITNVVSYLEAEGHIERVSSNDRAGSTGGSRAPLYRYRANLGQVLGIDIGADKILIMLADLAGTSLGTVRLSTRGIHPFGPAEVVNQIARAVASLFQNAGLTSETLMAVVAGTPGVVSADGVVTMAPQLPGWEGLDLRQALSAIFPCPVQIEREVALSLQAERWVGVAAGVDDVLFVHLGVGIAAGLLIGGKIYRGADGGAGEIGMMPLPNQEDSQDNSRFGPFESQTGGIALQSKGREVAQTSAGHRLLELAGGTVENVDATVVFAAMREGDPAATDVVRSVVQTLAWGISALVCAMNPRTVILGGGIVRAADLILPDLQSRVAKSVPFEPQWLISSLGDEAVAIGAVHQAAEMVENNLFINADLGWSI